MVKIRFLLLPILFYFLNLEITIRIPPESILSVAKAQQIVEYLFYKERRWLCKSERKCLSCSKFLEKNFLFAWDCILLGTIRVCMHALCETKCWKSSLTNQSRRRTLSKGQPFAKGQVSGQWWKVKHAIGALRESELDTPQLSCMFKDERANLVNRGGAILWICFQN